MASLDNIGVLLPTRGVLVHAQSAGPRVELNWQMAETAERLGYDSVWVGDSITSKPRLEPLTIMAALGARTSRVKIGTAVMLKDRKSTRLNSSHKPISYAVFCLKKKKQKKEELSVRSEERDSV